MPSWKLTLGGTTEIINDQAVSIKNVRPENGISSLTLLINDYNSKYYTNGISNHTQIDLAIKCELPASYTTTFSGLVHDLRPVMTVEGEMLKVDCWGWGIALDKTLCDTSFGTESVHPTTDTPEEILDYLIANFVKKRFGPAGAATQWSMDTEDIDAPHADFSITNLTSNYQTNLTLVNRLCDLINAHAVSDSDIGVHWFVDPSKHFRMKEIDKNSTDEEWMQYYGWNWTKYNFKESKRIIARNFHTQVNDYYNSIILASAFRKPAYDTWTENNSGDWGATDCTLSDDVGGGAGEPAAPVVGTYHLKAESNIDGTCYFFYPSTQDLGIDITKIGSQNSVPRLNFQLATTDVNGNVQIGVHMVTDWAGADHFSYIGPTPAYELEDKLHDDLLWGFMSIPIGPYAMAPIEYDNFKWSKVGDADWSDINEIRFQFDGTADREDIFVDDLHISGKIVRHAYDASEIDATKKERQLLIRLDTALDDTLETTNNTGTAALLAEAELYKRTATPVVGTLEFDLKEDMLPGQKIKVWAGRKPDGTYRWSEQIMRIRKLTHIIDRNGFRTTAEVTSDVTNCNTRGITDQYSILMESTAALNHGEAKDLKASGVDPLIPRLAWDPT